ncbi:MAG: hypothetical protein AB8B63_16465 [Granulosicoccus sp.]
MIDGAEPTRWIVDLVERLGDVESVEIRIVHIDADQQSNATEPGSPAHSGPGHYITRWLIGLADKPRFDELPWSPDQLPLNARSTPLNDPARELADCDLVFDLCTTQWLEASSLSTDTPVWSADVKQLPQRVADTLLHKAPLLWLHLWERRRGRNGKDIDSCRITSHALPSQSFSITDLLSAGYCSLPAVFVSRLNWYLVNRQLVQDVSEQERSLGVFDCEQRDAELDASKWLHAYSSAERRNALKDSWMAVRLIMRQIWQRLCNRIFEDHWELAAYCTAADTKVSLADLRAVNVSTFKSMARSKDAIQADPHIIEHNGETYVFFERLHQHKTPAHIAVATIDNERGLIDVRCALKESTHLSYPFVFKHADEIYMVPESGSLQSIRLYKAISFPCQWQHMYNLVDGINAADSTLFRYMNRWWLFTNCQSHRCVDERDELHIYYADTLPGPWQPHAMNPVLTGVDRSRMAGPIISMQGNHYRLSQYGAKRYGHGINISRIDTLSPTEYRESAVHRIVPDSASTWLGCHSLGLYPQHIVIDRVRRRRKVSVAR